MVLCKNDCASWAIVALKEFRTANDSHGIIAGMHAIQSTTMGYIYIYISHRRPNIIKYLFMCVQGRYSWAMRAVSNVLHCVLEMRSAVRGTCMY